MTVDSWGSGWMVGAIPKFQIVDRAEPGGSRWRVVSRRVVSCRLDGTGPRWLRCSCRCPLSSFNAARRRAPGCWRRTPKAHDTLQTSKAAADSVRGPFPQAAVRRSFSRPPTKACPSSSAQVALAPARRTVRTEPVQGRLAVAHADPAASHRARRADDAGQHEVLGLPVFRQQSALRSAVPQHLQGRAQGPSQLWRPGLLAGRDLQRQPRAGARPRDFRRPQARRDRGVLPRQRRDAGTRRPRPANGAAADFGFRRQCRAAGAAARGQRRRFQRRQVLAAGRLQALHGRIGQPPRPALRRSEVGPGVRQHADRDRRLQRRLPADRLEPRGRRHHPTASAACSCSMPSTANSTSSPPGSRTTVPASSSAPTPATPSGATRN